MTKARELADLIANVNHGSSLGNKNLLINSSFAVNQRGASTVTSGYFLDRWTITSASATAQLTSSLPDGFSYGMSIAATSGNPIATQRIEAKNLENISGKIVTLSFYAKDLGNVGALYASLQTANSADNFGGTTTISEQTLTSDVPTSWTQYTCSWTIPAAGLNGLQLNILCAGSSTFTLGIVAPQLEIGEKATEFEHEPYAVTLQKALRYYQKHLGWITQFNRGLDNNYDAHVVNNGVGVIGFMRATPTETIANVYRWDAGDSDWTSDSTAFSAAISSSSQTFVEGYYGRQNCNAVKADWELIAEL